MKPITSPLRTVDRGADVANLQDALLLLIDRRIIQLSPSSKSRRISKRSTPRGRARSGWWPGRCCRTTARHSNLDGVKLRVTTFAIEDRPRIRVEHSQVIPSRCGGFFRSTRAKALRRL